jgi:hypothetical protein
MIEIRISSVQTESKKSFRESSPKISRTSRGAASDARRLRSIAARSRFVSGCILNERSIVARIEL